MEVTLDPRACTKLLSRSDVNASTLVVILMTLLGEEMWDMDPIELYTALESEFNTTLTLESENRINAMLTVANGPAFFNDPEVFRAVCLALVTGHPEDPADEALSPGLAALSVGDMRSAMYEVKLLLGEDDPGYGPEVRARFFDAVGDESAEDGLSNVVEDSTDVVEQVRDDILRELTEIGFRNINMPPVT